MGKYSEAVARAQIVAIVRLDNYDRALAVAEALLAGGINAIEYTLTGSGAFAAVSKVRNALGDRMLVGVGTVLSEQDATESIAAGAQFLVTPAVRPKVIKKATKAGIPTCCGALTPTEALTAHEAGPSSSRSSPPAISARPTSKTSWPRCRSSSSSPPSASTPAICSRIWQQVRPVSVSAVAW
jgi:2-dehydro-3-deoxyphosphogluconate aldolase/(4S)-4-hydroxy-2-oxoglutarate aldolase